MILWSMILSNVSKDKQFVRPKQELDFGKKNLPTQADFLDMVMIIKKRQIFYSRLATEILEKRPRVILY